MGDTKTARVVWKGANLDFAAALGSGYAFDMSSRAGEAGGSPMEFLLAGVAGCTAVDVVMILQKKRQPISAVEVEISGLRADERPRTYTAVDITYRVRGDVDPRAVEQAIELSEEKYCSASVMFRNAGVAISSSYRIEPASEPQTA